MAQRYKQVEHNETLIRRCEHFLEVMNDVTVKPVKVFDALNPKILSELELIREVSRELQAKKEEDMIKAKEAAAEKVVLAETGKENGVSKEETSPPPTPEVEEKKE